MSHDAAKREGKVQLGYFSFTEVTRPDEHQRYNEWHQLDHMPEQIPLRGVVHGQRWVSSPACRAARLASEPALDPIHYLTLYLMSEPARETLRDFFELGRHLHDMGRFHEHRSAHLSGPLRLLDTRASERVLVSAEAVPYRPNRGVYVTVEDCDRAELDERLGAIDARASRVLGTPGVAGMWVFGPDPDGLGRRALRQLITVCYLDEDPLRVSAALEGTLEADWAEAGARPTFAGPFETISPWKWDWFDASP